MSIGTLRNHIWVEIEPPSEREKRQHEREMLHSMIPVDQRATRSEAVELWRSLSATTGVWQCVNAPRLLRIRIAGSDAPLIFDRQSRELLSDADARAIVQTVDWVWIA